MTEYFWILTLRWSYYGETYTETFQGVYLPRKEDTRTHMFKAIRDEARLIRPDSAGGAVLFFHIEPNKL